MECAPYSKAGGLADVASELPDALAALGHDVVTIAPWHEPAAARPPPLVEAMRMRMPWRCAHGGEEASWIGVSVMRLERMRDRRVELRRRRARKEEEEEEGDRRRHHHHHYYAPLLGARRYLGNAFHRLRRTVWSVLADGGDNNNDDDYDDYGGGDDDDISSERALARRFFVRSPPYARNGAVYGPDSGSDYGDNDLRMLLLCRTALRIPERILFPNNYTDDVSSSTPPSSRIVVVMNDFHAAPAALLMRYGDATTPPHSSGSLADARPLLALLVHNAAHRGSFPASRLGLWGIRDADGAATAMRAAAAATTTTSSALIPPPPPSSSSSSPLHWLLGAAALSDALFTVSPTYAREIPANDPLLAASASPLSFFGIVNGISPAVWDPRTDPALRRLGGGYDERSAEEGKRRFKARVWRKFGETASSSVLSAPLFVYVGRLDVQKGVDVIVEAINAVLDAEAMAGGGSGDPHGVLPAGAMPFGLIVLGTGDAGMSKSMRNLAARSRRSAWAHVAFVDGFDEALARQLYAAGDFVLVPSRWEPCGLVQLIGMRYGALPIVSDTGGLSDTVPRSVGWFCDVTTRALEQQEEGLVAAGYRSGYACGGGIAGAVSADASRLWSAMRCALEADAASIRRRREAAMSLDVSWDASALAWEAALRRVACGEHGGGGQ